MGRGKDASKRRRERSRRFLFVSFNFKLNKFVVVMHSLFYGTELFIASTRQLDTFNCRRGTNATCQGSSRQALTRLAVVPRRSYLSLCITILQNGILPQKRL